MLAHQPIRLSYAFLVFTIGSAVVLALVWRGAGRGPRWLDLAFAVGCGILLTLLMFAIQRGRRAVASRPFLIRFGAGFVIYLSSSLLLLVLPDFYLHFLHPPDKNEWSHNVFFSVAWSLLMGLSWGIEKHDTLPPPLPGEPGHDITKEPWFDQEVAPSDEKSAVHR
jgi:hypothetical protein